MNIANAEARSNAQDVADDLALITEVAVRAGDLALPYFSGDIALDVTIKSGNSPVTEADHVVNAYLLEQLSSARPEYGWLSEETNDDDKSTRINAERTFVVDPIDGTRGFIEGRDMWCVSVGIVENGRPIAGVLVCPARSEVFTAMAGGGAFLNGQQLELAPTLTDTPFLGGPRVYLDAMDMQTTEVFARHPHVPSLAYRLAMVATGKLSGTFVKPNAHDWDIAAADIILHEAGGTLVDHNGERFVLNQEDPKKSVMIASHPDLLSRMLRIVVETSFG